MKKIIILTITAMAVIGIVQWKQRAVVAKRERKIVSLYKEWAKHGKPVVVKTIKRADVPEYTKFTVKKKSAAIYEGYVTKNVKQRLKAGQPVFIKDGSQRAEGQILVVSTDLVVETGLYYVRISLKNSVETTQPFHVCFATTRTYMSAINIPSEAAQGKDGRYHVWIATTGGLAKLQEIILASRNGYGFNVKQGLNEGDQLIVAGQSMLHDGEKIKIIEHRK